jgi:cytochrome P450
VIEDLRSAEPGEPYGRWVREYQNITGLIRFPFLSGTRVIATSSALPRILGKPDIYKKPDFENSAFEDMVGKGILTAKGRDHTRQRKVLSRAFIRSNIPNFMPIFSSEAEGLVDTISKQLDSQTNEGIEIRRPLGHLTFNIIGFASLLISYFADVSSFWR